MATIPEIQQESTQDAEKDLVVVSDGSAEVLMQAFRDEDQGAIDDYFYTICSKVSSYLNGVPANDRVSAAFQLMHNQIDALGDVDMNDEKRAATRLNADALLQTCLLPLPPYAPWELVDLMGHATMRTTDVASDVLLPILTRKLAELPPDAFDRKPSDAPIGVHLLRIRSVGVLGAYHEGSRRQMKQILQRYQQLDVPLLAMAAQIEADNCELDREIKSNGTDRGRLSRKSADLLQRQAVYEERYCDVMMPNGFDARKQYVRIASDAVASYAVGNNVERFVRITPDVPITQSRLRDRELLSEVDAYSETAYPLLYDRYMLGAMGDRLGLYIIRMPLTSQQKLFDFMIESDKQRFMRVENIIQGMPSERRLLLAEAFLALEFGDDYGESLLTIAEKAKPEQTNEIASIIGEYRKLSARFGELFEGYNLELAKSVEVSINEKCTDILVAIEEILVKGSIEVEVMKGVYADFDSINEAIETMYDLLISLRQIVNILNSKLMSVDIAEQGDGYKIFRLSDKDNGNILAYIRPHGSKTFDEAVEYGRPGQGVEASINFKVNPLDPFEPLSPSKDMGAVSLRLDREGISENDSWDAPHRDPTRNEGMVSLDVSAQFGKENSPEVKIARLIASGNKIRYGRGVSGAQDTLHHTNRQFDQESFGTAEGFADVARYIQEIIESRLKSSSLSRLSSLLVKNG